MKIKRVANRAGRRKDGAEGQNRTADTIIFSHVLYQLSYLGTSESNYLPYGELVTLITVKLASSDLPGHARDPPMHNSRH